MTSWTTYFSSFSDERDREWGKGEVQDKELWKISSSTPCNFKKVSGPDHTGTSWYHLGKEGWSVQIRHSLLTKLLLVTINSSLKWPPGPSVSPFFTPQSVASGSPKKEVHIINYRGIFNTSFIQIQVFWPSLDRSHQRTRRFGFCSRCLPKDDSSWGVLM